MGQTYRGYVKRVLRKNQTWGGFHRFKAEEMGVMKSRYLFSVIKLLSIFGDVLNNYIWQKL